MSLARYLTLSLIIHLLIVLPIGLNIQKTKTDKFLIPEKWIIDVNLVLQGKDMQLFPAGAQRPKEVVSAPGAGPEKNASEVMPDSARTEPVKNETLPGNEEAFRAMHEQTQIQARQTQEAMIARMNMQFLIFHTRAFFKGARLSVLSFLFSEMNGGDWDALNGSTASVRLAYGDDGTLKDIEISSESEELKRLLERIKWKAVPQPSSYFLAYKGLNLKITVKNSIPVVDIEVL